MWMTVLTLGIFSGFLGNEVMPQDPPRWYGLGENECYDETCQLGQFCSDNPVRGLRCRNCSEIVSSWCREDLFDEFRHRFPSCEALCIQNTVEKLREKNQDLEDKNQEINKTLEETKQRCSKLEGELAATGQALKRALDDSSQSDKLENISGKLLKTEDELNQTNTALKNARDAESKSKMEVENLAGTLVQTENDLNTTKQSLEDAENEISRKTEELEKMGNQKDRLEAENAQLRLALEQASDQVIIWQIVSAICGPGLLILVGCLIGWRCVRQQKKKKKKMNRNYRQYSPVYRGKAPDEAPVTPRARQTDGQPLDRTQNPLLPATPASLNDTDANINNTNNLNSTASTSPTTGGSVNNSPRKVNNISPSTSGNSTTPNSSSSSLSDRLAPSGERTESHPNDHKDFSLTVN